MSRRVLRLLRLNSARLDWPVPSSRKLKPRFLAWYWTFAKKEAPHVVHNGLFAPGCDLGLDKLDFCFNDQRPIQVGILVESCNPA